MLDITKTGCVHVELLICMLQFIFQLSSFHLPPSQWPKIMSSKLFWVLPTPLYSTDPFTPSTNKFLILCDSSMYFPEIFSPKIFAQLVIVMFE